MSMFRLWSFFAVTLFPVAGCGGSHQGGLCSLNLGDLAGTYEITVQSHHGCPCMGNCALECAGAIQNNNAMCANDLCTYWDTPEKYILTITADGMATLTQTGTNYQPEVCTKTTDDVCDLVFTCRPQSGNPENYTQFTLLLQH